MADKENPDGFLDSFTRIDELIDKTNELRQKLIDLYPIGAAELKFPASLITIPLDPETLNTIIEAQALGRGTYKSWFWRIALLIPATTTRTITLTVPEGWVETRRSPFMLFFTYHDDTILLNATIGGEEFTSEDCPCSADMELSFGEFYAKHPEDVIEIEIVNNSATDTLMTMDYRPSYISGEFFDEIYDPLIKKGFTTLQKLIEKVSEYATV